MGSPNTSRNSQDQTAHRLEITSSVSSSGFAQSSGNTKVHIITWYPCCPVHKRNPVASISVDTALGCLRLSTSSAHTHQPSTDVSPQQPLQRYDIHRAQPDKKLLGHSLRESSGHLPRASCYSPVSLKLPTVLTGALTDTWLASSIRMSTSQQREERVSLRKRVFNQETRRDKG